MNLMINKYEPLVEEEYQNLYNMLDADDFYENIVRIWHTPEEKLSNDETVKLITDTILIKHNITPDDFIISAIHKILVSLITEDLSV